MTSPAIVASRSTATSASSARLRSYSTRKTAGVLSTWPSMSLGWLSGC